MSAETEGKQRRAHGGSAGVLSGSGEVLQATCGAGDLGWPETKTMAMAAPRGAPACVARRGGSWRRGGAPGLVGEVRGRRWLRLRWVAATAALGRRARESEGRRESEREEGRPREREREGRGGAWRPRMPPAASREAGGGRR